MFFTYKSKKQKIDQYILRKYQQFREDLACDNWDNIFNQIKYSGRQVFWTCMVLLSKKNNSSQWISSVQNHFLSSIPVSWIFRLESCQLFFGLLVNLVDSYGRRTLESYFLILIILKENPEAILEFSGNWWCIWWSQAQLYRSSHSHRQWAWQGRL